MFYCEDCRKERNWPEAYIFSHGPCECCGNVTRCHDRPSKTLPLPPGVDEAELERVLARYRKPSSGDA